MAFTVRSAARLSDCKYVEAAGFTSCCGRVLAPSKEALDTPLRPPRSLAVPGVCYSALRDLPRRDFHPLETNSVKRTVYASASSRRTIEVILCPQRQWWQPVHRIAASRVEGRRGTDRCDLAGALRFR